MKRRSFFKTIVGGFAAATGAKHLDAKDGGFILPGEVFSTPGGHITFERHNWLNPSVVQFYACASGSFVSSQAFPQYINLRGIQLDEKVGKVMFAK